MTSGSLWNYYRNDIDSVDINDNVSVGKSFEYKTKITGKTLESPPQSGNSGDANQLARPPVPNVNVEVTIPLKYLSNFWTSLDLRKDCVLIQHHNNIGSVAFKITSIKLYVPVVTLTINDNIKFLENLRRGFKRTIS